MHDGGEAQHCPGSAQGRRRLRLLLLTPDFPPATGGIQVVMERLARHIGDFRTTVVTRRASPGHARQGGSEYQLYRAGRPAAGSAVSLALFSAASILRGLRARPDVILTGHVVAAPASVVVSRVLGVPFVMYVHADEVRTYPRLSRLGARCAARVLCVSGHAAELARSVGVRDEQIEIIPPGVDAPSARSGERPGSSPARVPTIVTVSRLRERYKGHDVMLVALEAARREIPDAHWVVVGDGPLRAELEAATRAADLETAVTYVGTVTDERRDAILRAADIFAMPSRLPPGEGGEGFGIVFLEAGAHGLPVVAGNVGGALDAVVDGETGLLVDPESPLAVSEALVRLLLDPELAQRMGRAGRARAAAFNWPHIADRVNTTLLEVQGEARGRS